jgi:hypothetical protein
MKRSIFQAAAAVLRPGLAFLLLGADLCLHLAGSDLAGSDRRAFDAMQEKARDVAHLTALGLLEPSGARHALLIERYR